MRCEGKVERPYGVTDCSGRVVFRLRPRGIIAIKYSCSHHLPQLTRMILEKNEHVVTEYAT